MYDTEHKYVRLKEYNQFIFFPKIIQHSTFAHLEPISVDFCYLDQETIKCYGKSVSLDLESLDDDSFMATKQVLGFDVGMELMK